MSESIQVVQEFYEALRAGDVNVGSRELQKEKFLTNRASGEFKFGEPLPDQFLRVACSGRRKVPHTDAVLSALK